MINVMKNDKYKINTKKLLEYIKSISSFEKILYIDLGVKIIRLVCCSELFVPHIQKQLTYTLRENAQKYDDTIILWNQKDLDEIGKVKGLLVKSGSEDENSADFVMQESTITAYLKDKNTFFYGVQNLEPEVFVKEGHIFVQMLNQLLKTENTSLIHGACVGLDNKGILFCARGQKGKSTLTVLSLLQGFEYVSDDYLVLEKDNEKLYAYPIYSIITLSPRMYNELYDKLDGTRFLSNNARKDKYVINISNLHNQFKKKYPIELCMSLEFTTDTEPSIVECSKLEKGRAITQLVHSTVMQMFDMYDAATVKKLIGWLNVFKFYKINLCNNIYKNVECLEKFMKESKNDKISIK